MTVDMVGTGSQHPALCPLPGRKPQQELQRRVWSEKPQGIDAYNGPRGAGLCFDPRPTVEELLFQDVVRAWKLLSFGFYKIVKSKLNKHKRTTPRALEMSRLQKGGSSG